MCTTKQGKPCCPKKTTLLPTGAFPWQYDGDAFRAHFNVIHNLHNMIKSALMDTLRLSKHSMFGKDKEALSEIYERLEMYFDVLLCLFWDAVFHRNLSHLNSKETLTLRELTRMILLGLDMLANVGTVGLAVTYNMR